MENYKELKVWQKSVSLCIELYGIVKKFPENERYGLITQIQRASTSVPANIAEGWGRGSTKEYIQFLHIARGSLMELETHLIISQKLGYIGVDTCNGFHGYIEEIGKMINQLINALKKVNVRRLITNPQTLTPKP
jgi:four helix bundle protein